MSIETRKGGCICFHLIDKDDLDVYRQFTGLGAAYNLICRQCYEIADTLEANLREVSEEKFKETDHYCQGFVGEAEIFQRASNLEFTHNLVHLNESLPA